MNHPTREEWMSYLYDELTAEERSSLAAHLAGCPDCKIRVNDWRAARRSLDAWPLPARPARVPLHRPLVRWAAAAALMIGIGFGVGRFATPATADAGRIRQQLRQEFTQLLREELDNYAEALETRHTEESQAIQTALNRLEAQLLADVVSLKKDVDTVAVYADAGLRRARQDLVQLADYTQPVNTSNSLQK